MVDTYMYPILMYPSLKALMLCMCIVMCPAAPPSKRMSGGMIWISCHYIDWSFGRINMNWWLQHFSLLAQEEVKVHLCLLACVQKAVKRPVTCLGIPVTANISTQVPDNPWHIYWREGYRLPTRVRKITCRHFNWMLQSSSGRKWRSANKHCYLYSNSSWKQITFSANWEATERHIL